MFYFDDYDIEDFDDYAVKELTKTAEKLNLIAKQYEFGTDEFAFFVGLRDEIQEPLRIRKENKVINNFEKLRTNVEEWAKDKDLLHSENADKQFMKFIEEVFEFKSEMDLIHILGGNELNSHDMMLEMGDIFVTLIILCEQLEIDPVVCLEMAYKKISQRRGRTIDGVFYKQEDLEGME